MKTLEQKAADYCRNTHGICATCKKVKKCNIICFVLLLM